MEVLIKRILDTSGLVTTTFLNTKISEFQTKTSSVAGLAKKIDYDAKIRNTQGKHFTTADYNKFTIDILDVMLKQKVLVN